MSFIVKALALAPAVFGVMSHGGRWWLAEPSGKPFWAFSVDCVDQGESAKEYKSDNPGFGSYRLYSSPVQWANVTLGNLESWGFNSLGGWSDHEDLAKLAPSRRLPYCEVLHLGAYAQLPFHDMFAPEAHSAMADAAKSLIPKLRDDPYLIGYYTDNELGWWGDTLFISYLAMPDSSPGKQRLMAEVRSFYHDDFESFRKDWISDAASFEEVARIGKLKLRPGGNGIHLVNAWLGVMGDYYYKLVHDLVREQDSRHLILGDRYCQFYEIPIAKASRPYIDVASTNFGATWNDGSFAHFFLDELHELTQKPVIVGEFYMGAKENRSGNKNVPAAFPLVETQKERAAAFAKDVNGLASLPFVVGAQWFQYYDEPPKGRGDGENFNHGLVDTQGRSYELMVKAAQEADPARVHAKAIAPVRPQVLAIPRAPADPLKDLKLWPRIDGYVPPQPGFDFGDLYVCRDDAALYVGLIAMDYADPHLYEGDRIPMSDRMEWTLNLSDREPIHIWLGSDDQKAVCDDPTVQISELHGLQHVALLRIPEEGALTELRSSVSTHGMGYSMFWHARLLRSSAVFGRHSTSKRSKTRIGFDFSSGRQCAALNQWTLSVSPTFSPARCLIRGRGSPIGREPAKFELATDLIFGGRAAVKNQGAMRTPICGASVEHTQTRFRVVDQNGIAWIVKPDGTKMLSRGVCCVEPGATAKTYDPKNPAYAAYREYVSTDEWGKNALERLTDWGFNTVGAWSDTVELLKPNQPNLVFTPILHMGSGAGAPWRDMWDPKIVALMDSIARNQILPLKGESRVMGYFSDNEMGWWNGAMFDWAFKAGTHSRSQVVALLRKRYGNRWTAVLQDFEAPGVGSFEELKAKGRLYLLPGKNGMATVHAWMRVVSDRYYSLCREIIKKYDPGALYLGDRYISNFYPEVAESAGKYCDVVTTNLNADTNDGAFAPFYLSALHAIAKRPIMITEYYEAAKENRSGNKNDSSGFPVVKTQAQRAASFWRQTETILGMPFVVGAHWFQYSDEAMNGRGDGENYDMGLVDIEDRPYERLVAANRAIDANRLHAHPSRAKRMAAPPELNGKEVEDIEAWIDRAFVVPSVGLNTRGNLFLARHAGRLYACIYWNEDLFPEALHRSGKLPPEDAPRLEFMLGSQKLHVFSPSAGDPVMTNGATVKYKFGIRNYIICELPKVTAATSLKATMWTRARAYRMSWSSWLPRSLGTIEWRRSAN